MASYHIEVNLREFIRNFSRIRKKANSGAEISVRGDDAVYIFRLSRPPSKKLLGCCAHLQPPDSSVPGPVESPDAWDANK